MNKREKLTEMLSEKLSEMANADSDEAIIQEISARAVDIMLSDEDFVPNNETLSAVLAVAKQES